MSSTLKLSFVLVLTGACLYMFFSFLGISNTQYFHVVTPSLTERSHPLKTALQVNDTYDSNTFHDVYYDPYDLYL